MTEVILEPDLPIIDPHHHLWDLRPLLPAFAGVSHPFLQSIAEPGYYMFDTFTADARSGHRVVASVFVECGAFYNAAYGPNASASEVEFANGVAAQGASGLYGEWRPCAGIVGHVDLTASDAGARLDRLQAASPRLVGIRHQGAWDADPAVLGPPFHAPEGLYRQADFRRGFAELAPRGLTFDAWVLEPQLPDVIDLARTFPEQPIVLDHCGTPLGIATYAGRLPERFGLWTQAIRTLAQCPNVSIKLGGLAMAFSMLPDEGPAAGWSSERLAPLWGPYIDTCIEAFGAGRAMFESNYPVDRWGASYPVLWNTFKRLTAGASADEKADLFAGTAARFYGLADRLPDGLDIGGSPG